MKYVRISSENRRVVEIIPEFDLIFPNVPINERYTEEFISALIEVADNTEVEEGMVYSWSNGTFTEYVEPVSETDDVTWDLMAKAIAEGVNEI